MRLNQSANMMNKPTITLIITAALFALPTTNAQAKGLTNLKGTSWNTLFRTSIHFGVNGRVSGHAGCNRFFGTYRQNGKFIRIMKVATTRKMCPARKMSREYLMLRKLKEVRRFKGTSSQMKLYGKRNFPVFTLLPIR